MKNKLPNRYGINAHRLFLILTALSLSVALLVSVGLAFGLEKRKTSYASKTTYLGFMPAVINNGVYGGSPPVIDNITADDTTIIEGEAVTLDWDVTGVVSGYDITPDPELADANEAIVRPTKTTTYRVRVFNSHGSDTAEITIQVFSPDGPAIISNFSAADEVIAPGDATTLSWDVDGLLNSLEISPELGAVAQKASAVVSPTETTTYTLTAVNKFGTTSAQVVVKVVAPPVITTFTASPNTINLGEQTTLSWNVEGDIDSLTINPGDIDVTGQSSIALSPSETTTYTLTAENIKDTVQAETHVVVIPPPSIAAFEAQANNPLFIGDTVTMSWSVINEPTALSLTPGIGDVLGTTSVVFTATADMTYTLSASNGAGSDTESLFLDVVEPPTIDSFAASTELAFGSEAVTLTWSTTGEYLSLWITQGVGDVTGQNQVVVTPSKNTKYTLIATNDSGSVSASVDVNYASGNSQITFYDWDKTMTTNHHGFANDNTPDENYDWTGPVNYAQGTLYVRAAVFDQPVAQQKMKMQICFWQELNGYNFGLENCMQMRNVPGTPGTVVCWSQPVNQMWKKNGDPIDWTRPRYRVGVAIKNQAGDPVSDYNGWNWNGENPDEWYDLDLRFTAIVVAKDFAFTGFDDCTIEE